MKVSRTWLQKYFDTELPDTGKLADALTFHAFEIEDVDRDMLDVNVLPDRACYGLSHRGIASELSAILSLPMAKDPLQEPLATFPVTDLLSVDTDPAYVLRHTGALMRGITVGPSPAWLQEALESVGQRSINSVVDAMNYVMLDVGQPSGGFDVAKLVKDGEVVRIAIRRAENDEKITDLTETEHVLTSDMFVFTDAIGGTILDVAGVKGGKDSGVTEATTDLFLSAGNYDPTLIRRTSQRLKLFTDASIRFQNRISPELTAYGMRDIITLIQQVAGGEIVGVTDTYTKPTEQAIVTASIARINATLGTDYGAKDVTGALDRLRLPHRIERDAFVIDVPFERRDLAIPEDIAEEVGRILGYDRLKSLELPPLSDTGDQRRYRGLERVKDTLLDRGYVEISTPSFTEEGEIELANPLQTDRPFLRPDLAGNMREALIRARREAPRVLGPDLSLKLFEIGTVFEKEGEHLSLALGYEALGGKASKTVLDEDIDALKEAIPNLSTPAHDGTVAELSLAASDLESAGDGYTPKRIILGPYRPFSIYPFALRDVAVWTPEGTQESEVAILIQKEASELLARMDLFDRFDKEGRTSYAFRLVFESYDRTLSDSDLDPLMERITTALNAREGWEVR